MKVEATEHRKNTAYREYFDSCPLVHSDGYNPELSGNEVQSGEDINGHFNSMKPRTGPLWTPYHLLALTSIAGW